MQTAQQNIISQHRIRSLVFLSNVLVFIILVSVGLLGFYSINNYITNDIASELPSFYQYIPVIPIAMAVLLLLRTISMLSQHVIIYSDGIGNGKKIWSWQDVTWYQGTLVNHYYLFIPVGKTYYFSLVFKDGQRMAIDSQFSDSKHLFMHLSEELGKLNLQMPAY